jgi:hypothetical protein
MNEITEGQTRHSLDELRFAMDAAKAAGELPEGYSETTHYHADGLYGRRTFAPAGSTILTVVHKAQHITLALKGIATVIDEVGNRKDVFAPAVFITEPGTQRAVYAHTDVEWMTVHACEEQDVPTIEKLLTCDTMAEYNQLQLENKS